MRVVCVSDTHGLHDRITVPEGDVMIHAGDLTMMGTDDQLGNAFEWISGLPHVYKIVVAGNHDWGADGVANGVVDGVFYLRDGGLSIGGLHFWGSPWQPEFGNWAFNLPRNGPEIRDRWDQIPKNTDVLITHGPPHGILDRCQDFRTHLPKQVSVGCELLRRRVSQVRPRLHVFGHIHEGHGSVKVDGTMFVNASICTRGYKPTNKPIVVDL